MSFQRRLLLFFVLLVVLPIAVVGLLLLEVAGEGLSIDWRVASLLVWVVIAAIAFAVLLARTLSEVHERVAAEAATDPLTGLSNRRRFEEVLDRELDRCRRFDLKLSLLMIDVDDFKQINDRYGHQQGDNVLLALAELIAHDTRSLDYGARLGGDEFALILVETDAAGAERLADRLRGGVEERRIPLRSDGSMSATVSIGSATVPDTAIDRISLITVADEALYEAKADGKNRFIAAPGNSVSARRNSPSHRLAG